MDGTIVIFKEFHQLVSLLKRPQKSKNVYETTTVSNPNTNLNQNPKIL